MGIAIQGIDDIALTEASCAKLFYTAFANRFRYAGRNVWYYVDPSTGAWMPDRNKNELKRCIRTEFCTLVMQRATLWQDLIPTLPAQESHDVGFRVKRLLEVARKLQTDDFVRSIVREAAEWFEQDGAPPPDQ